VAVADYFQGLRPWLDERRARLGQNISRVDVRRDYSDLIAFPEIRLMSARSMRVIP
jgi:hypothetical protein